jgi:hypothetical protein
MKILFCYPDYPSVDTYGNIEQIWLRHIAVLKGAGFEIKPFCVSVNPPSLAMWPNELERLWKTGDRHLLKMYESLASSLSDCDVLLNVTGVNLHPEFIRSLDKFTVFQFNDDPENNSMSRFMAPAYDLCLVGNIAEVETYKSWGIERVHWMPIGLQPHLYDHTLTYDSVLSGDRDIDLFMMIDRLTPWRKARLDQFAQAFPDGHFYGRGWPRGYLDASIEIDFLLRAKISPNFHNSTGPINYRTFYAPANGVMLICDNKKFLGEIYELGKEAVGFDSVEECIDLTNYYLRHDQARRLIAANGWRRVINDYNELAVFKRTIMLIQKYIGSGKISVQPKSSAELLVRKRRGLKKYFFRVHYLLVGFVQKSKRRLKKFFE